MRPTTDSFSLMFLTAGPQRFSLLVKSENCGIPVDITAPKGDVLSGFQRAIEFLESRMEGGFTVPLTDSGMYDARLEKKGGDGYFALIGYQKAIGYPRDGKERYLMLERLPFEKLKLRVRKGIERYVNDPNRKKANT